MRIIIVDDDPLVCASLKMIIETDPDISVIGIGYSGQEAIDLYKKLNPDILLMDIRMDGMNGLEAGEIILNQFPQAKILFLTTFSDEEYIIKSLKLGIKGYILKQNYESIIPALKALNTGQSVLGGNIIAKIPTLIERGPLSKSKLAEYPLNEREREIMRLVADGLNNKEIAQRLYLSEGTIRNSISTILDKLQLRDRTQLAIFYYKNQ